ncbi:ACP synthase [Mycoplasmopsis pullorum]|uniref:4'-phosphopantetheinyl transferase superfamily protein n=2 Tax=Mycoplasmopsis pullorum TaxID=48003 RepID=UPI00111AEA67|nr:4'-phosphopantetheinyl transferase superfamily protein [Mycoplasmopsis pullorum]TNK92362.1 ACP synthase [Mycoplasmopsis pullorum]
MIGVDLTKISRFANLTDAFIQRFLHLEEYEIYQNITNEKQKQIFLAKIWAIKEAIFKIDNSYSHFDQVKLDITDKGVKHPNFWISISHEEDFLVAFVMKKE